MPVDAPCAAEQVESEESLDVVRKNREAGIPMDVLHLDSRSPTSGSSAMASW